MLDFSEEKYVAYKKYLTKKVKDECRPISHSEYVDITREGISFRDALLELEEVFEGIQSNCDRTVEIIDDIYYRRYKGDIQKWKRITI